MVAPCDSRICIAIKPAGIIDDYKYTLTIKVHAGLGLDSVKHV